MERGTRQAASLGAEWTVSGELVVSGYRFAPKIGTSWIAPQPDDWLRRYALIAKDLAVPVFVSQPELEPSAEAAVASNCWRVSTWSAGGAPIDTGAP